MTSGTRHLILGRTAIIERMQANNDRTSPNIRIPRPSTMEDVKPISILDRLEVMAEGNCVITKNARELTSMVVSVDAGTRSIMRNCS